MQKRGQASIFAIIGIVLVILIALFFFLRNEYGLFVEPTVFISDKARPIEDNLRNCINKIGIESLNTFGKQGGDFNPANYLLYKSRQVKYYCTNIPEDEKCLNLIPTFDDVTTELNNYLQEQARDCVDKDLVKGGLGYEIKASELKTFTTATGNNILVRAEYPVEITKGEVKTAVKPVIVSFDIPLKEIYSVAVDVVNAEANTGSFEQLLYMLTKKGQYIINLDKPYPDKVYKLQKNDNDFELWFAVQGEERI